MKQSLEILSAQVIRQIISGAPALHLVVVPSDNDALLVEECLRQMAGGQFTYDEIVSLPNFIQSGVYRFESSRRTLARRLGALHKVRNKHARCVVISSAALMRLVPSSDWLKSQTTDLSEGMECDQDDLWEKLLKLGYQTVQRVEEVGECAIRGGILDFWTPGEKHPVRCEFFGDVVEKIRRFRPTDQRSYESIGFVSLLPAREFVWPNESDASAWIDRFNKAILSQGLQGNIRNDLLENIRCSIPFPGIDDLTSLFSSTEFVAPLAFFESFSTENHLPLQFHILSTSDYLLSGLQEVTGLYQSAWESGYGRKNYSQDPRAFESGLVRLKVHM
jgi:transcription-repair coupling factor (superfamily II helicase)